ncbi:MAG TPA: CPBP family intramembrane glutamic endopeptidase [Candidatus Binatia bacterium]|nr:CPBP family intramembrane glutamic endopeptidase [Candidatus Binatia bacterium]
MARAGRSPTARLLLLVLGILVVTSILSPGVAWLTRELGFDFKFSRVWNRCFQVLLVVGLLATWRRLELGAGADGIGIVSPTWRRDLGLGLMVGFAGIGVGLLACWLGGALVPDLRFDPAKTVWKAALGLAAAIALGFGEEALFRGILLRRLMLDFGARWGVVVTTGIYAVVHALRPGSSRDLHMWAGVERTIGIFAPLAEPAAIASVAGLAGLGALLAFARIRGASLWLPIGIHAAWVAVFRVGRLFFDIRKKPAWLIGPGWPPVVGGVGGWIALVISFVVLLLVLKRLRRSDVVPTLAPAV